VGVEVLRNYAFWSILSQPIGLNYRVAVFIKGGPVGWLATKE
jgi:hypothetical protein